MTDTARRAGFLALALILFVGIGFAVTRCLPRHDPLASHLARKDEKKTDTAARGIGADTQARNTDTTVHVDLTTKEVRDAFQSIPAPVPSSAAGADPRPLPAAPVGRLRDRLNEGIARANRSAGTAGQTD